MFFKLQNVIGSLVVVNSSGLRGLIGGTWLGIFEPVAILKGIFEGVFDGVLVNFLSGVFVNILPGVFGVLYGVVFSMAVLVWSRLLKGKTLCGSIFLVEL